MGGDKHAIGKAKPKVIIGIDLAGSPKRDTGICVIRGNRAETRIAHTDQDILDFVRSFPGAKAIGIDAPLSLPPGRESIDEKGPEHFRPCDLALRARGIRFFPITIGPMRMLTRRGMALKSKLKGLIPGTSVLEVYPGATFDILGIPRKDGRRILHWARKSLSLPCKAYTQDELDAIAAAITIRLHIAGKSETLGNARGGCIVVPSQSRSGKPARRA